MQQLVECVVECQECDFRIKSEDDVKVPEIKGNFHNSDTRHEVYITVTRRFRGRSGLLLR